MTMVLRLILAIVTAISGYAHAYLYVHGYQHIPTIGPGFLVQASAFFALALLIAVGGPDWLTAAAGLGSAGALVAFALSRTVGLFGFSETGWDPSPYAAVSVLTEAAAVVLAGVLLAKYLRRLVPAPTSRTEPAPQP